jgi:hypothetical protein
VGHQGRSILKPFHRSLTAAALACAVFVTAVGAHAAPSVVYSVTDVADAIPGADTWQYVFSIQGGLPPFYTLEFSFNSTLYADVDVPASGHDSSFLDTVLVTPGMPGVDALVDVGHSTGVQAPTTFQLNVTWLGGASQRPRAISWAEFDDTFAPTGASGVSTLAAVVPEPASMALALAGLGVLAFRKRPG